MTAPDPIPFKPEWPEPAPHLLRPQLPPAPALPLEEIMKPKAVKWVRDGGEAKSAPPDYVFAGLLTVVATVIGNSRWVSPWKGWAEPPIIWTMCIGLPSAGKSPGLDAILQPLRDAERPMREAAKANRAEWQEASEVAKIIEKEWKAAVREAVQAGETPPERPKGCNAGPPPHMPRLVVNDGTIERVAEITARQPRGTLQMRDELAGWIHGMQRYSGGGSDRPFWLEAYGGRGFTVERIGREPLTIERLTVGVMGGIQPDPLKSLLHKVGDDGLVARFIPIWPDPAPLCRPRTGSNEALMEKALSKLLTLDLVTDENGADRPWFLHFTEEAQALMDEFRRAVREWENQAEGLMLSFMGKLPGLAARLALILGHIDWAIDEAEEPREITAEHFGRAAHLVEAYIVPMARRSYAEAAAPKKERAARHLINIIQEEHWDHFTPREVQRLDRKGLQKIEEINPALKFLEDEACIRSIEQPASPQGGRPKRVFKVNPLVHRRQE